MRATPPTFLALAALLAVAVPAAGQSAPSGHRLFLAPTARPVEGGAVGVIDLAVPTAVVGVGGGVTVGAAVVVAPTPDLAGIVLVEPRWTVWDRPALAVAVGVAARANPFQDGAVHAAPYVVATAGRGGLAGTVGVGGRASYERRLGPWSYFREGSSTDWTPAGARRRTVHVVPAPAVFAGLEARVSERTTWIVEATALPDQTVGYGHATPGGADVALEGGRVHYDLTVGAGARVALGRTVLDLGLVVGRDADGASEPAPIVAPWLGLSVGFGR